MKKYALVVAGGSGTRMNHTLPKQFIRIGAYPILMHTIFQFTALNESIDIILVLPPKEVALWKQLTLEYDFLIPTKIVHGGTTRIESVRNGLEAIQVEDGLVAIHDGVRPFIRPEIIQKSYETAAQFGNAIVAVNLKDSIREVQEGQSVARERSNYRLIQTPQTFKISIIKKAYQRNHIDLFTDDASVAEFDGQKIHLIEGDYQNIKITTPEDLLIAEAFLNR